MGLHESQSRFWENFIGRSVPFLTWASDVLGRQVRHPPSADQLYRLSNQVRPGLIRVEADEVTYNLHVIARFELEQALFDGSLAVADLPDAWDARIEGLLGVRPKNPVEGVLQDVHWSGGAFGYFPSYTLGNLYAAAFGATIQQAIPDLWKRVEMGRFDVILEWLRENVHRQGHRYDGPELVRRVVGERDYVEDFLNHLWSRHGALYRVRRDGQPWPDDER
jgi:carboxypeptidase Taq